MSVAAVSDSDGFGRHIEAVSRVLLGEPNTAMSKAGELRFRARGSMAVDLEKGAWHDHESGQGGGVLDLIVYRGEAKTKSQAVRWLDAQGIRPANTNTPAMRPVLVEWYDYIDADGVLLFQVCRYEPKDFRQRRPDDSVRGGWSWSVKGVQQVPFRLPQMLAAPDETIFVVEGEKDANALGELGLIATCNAGGAGKWPDALSQHFAGRRVVVLPDNDNAGREHASLVALKLRGIAADVRILELPGLPAKGDVSDWLQAGGSASALQVLADGARVVKAPVADVDDIHNMQAVDIMSWPHMSDKLQPLNTRPNLQHLLKNYGITARYNVIKKDMVITHPAQHGSVDGARAKAVNTIMSLCALNRLPKTEATAFLADIADDNQFNPVTEFIQSVPWDGRSRFDDLLATVKTREGFDRDLLSLLMRRWLISAIAAAAKPSGFWSKGVLVFQGDQSLGKTAWFRSLLPNSMRDMVKVDAHIDPANKDTVISAVSHWLVELGELDGTLRKADIARLKGFISQDVDQFRKPYGAAEEKFQRRTVFFASVNPEQFLADETGNVRWWTVPVVGVDYEHGIDVQQLWAEVFAWFDRGERWWLDRDEEAGLEGANAAHKQGDSWDSRIADYCVGRDTVDVSCVLEALGVEVARQGKGEQMRAASALRMLGYRRIKKRFGTATRWVWVKPGVDDADRPF